jgi:ubiquinone/menaquinone biosynthesis C-methylase UbiE
MDNKEAYNNWASIYDTAENKTRDLEAKALIEIFAKSNFINVLEIGCGTGKNTEWLMKISKQVTSVDFSEGMIEKAKEKIKSKNVIFKKFDIRDNWDFENNKFDLITCSLILEHIENLDFVFNRVSENLTDGGLFYIGELHPFKQYSGSKARFDNANGTVVLDCYLHNISDFYESAKRNNLLCKELIEWFDDDVKINIPRLLTMVFKKN